MIIFGGIIGKVSCLHTEIDIVIVLGLCTQFDSIWHYRSMIWENRVDVKELEKTLIETIKIYQITSVKNHRNFCRENLDEGKNCNLKIFFRDWICWLHSQIWKYYQRDFYHKTLYHEVLA